MLTFLRSFWVFKEMNEMNKNVPPPMEENQEKTIDLEQFKYLKHLVNDLMEVESVSHNQDNPEMLAKNALNCAAKFHEADWCGVVEADLIFNAWNPIWWTSGATTNDVVRKFFDQGRTSPSKEWMDALHNGQPIIIEDTTIYKDQDDEEYKMYHELKIDSLIAYPFWKEPSGFIIALNPRRYKNKVELLRIFSYVMYCSISEARHCAGTNKSFTIAEIKSMKDIVINLFGKFEIHTLNKTITEEDISSPMVIKVLTYLLLHPERCHSSRMLCDAIWSDQVIDNPGNKIKTLKYRLLSTLDDVLDHQLISCTNKGYQINPELNISTDYEQFKNYWLLAQREVCAPVKIEMLKKMIEIYRGPILASATGEHWIMHIQNDYHQKYIGAVNELLRLLYENHNFNLVQDYAQKVLEHEHNNKELYYWMIRATYQMGANAMARAELKNAEKALLEEEYEELVKALEK